MNEGILIGIARDMLWTAFFVSGPVLGAGLFAGLIVSIFQAVTQINEMTLTFIPKIIAAAAAVALFYSFMLGNLVSFTERMFHMIPGVLK